MKRSSLRPSPAARRKIWPWLAAVAYMGLIWLLSSMSRPPVPIEDIPFRDRGAHFIEYGALGFLVGLAMLRTWPTRNVGWLLVFAFFVTVIWGICDEIHQAFVPGRSSDWKDAVMDAAGALFGIGFWRIRRFARWAKQGTLARYGDDSKLSGDITSNT